MLANLGQVLDGLIFDLPEFLRYLRDQSEVMGHDNDASLELLDRGG